MFSTWTNMRSESPSAVHHLPTMLNTLGFIPSMEKGSKSVSQLNKIIRYLILCLNILFQKLPYELNLNILLLIFNFLALKLCNFFINFCIPFCVNIFTKFTLNISNFNIIKWPHSYFCGLNFSSIASPNNHTL